MVISKIFVLTPDGFVKFCFYDISEPANSLGGTKTKVIIDPLTKHFRR